MDVKIKNDNVVFNYRVDGVIIHNDKILFQKRKDDKYWALVGGRCKLNEISTNAIKRELKEELELNEIVNVELLWFAENFFEYKDDKIHEISLYFNVKLSKNESIYLNDEFERKEKNKNLIFKWFNVEEVDNIPIKPDFLKSSLINLSKRKNHYIEKED